MTSRTESVLVLHEAMGAGARADELDAIVQVEQVSDAMRELGYSVSAMATGLDLQATLDTIKSREPHCVFNLVESLAGNGSMVHFVPGLLSSANVPFTGSGSDAMYLSSQKLLAKQWMRLHRIPTPDFFLFDDEFQDESGTWIVKSVWEHASFGMDDGCVVKGAAAARTRIAECVQRHGGEWFAERFIDGREFNISVLESDDQAVTLPIAEMTFVDYPRGKPKIVGYAAKWDEAAPEYHATQRTFPKLSSEERESLHEVVRSCWHKFGLGGYARVDIRMDAAGVPWVLEVNTNPCLSQDAGFCAAAVEAGMTYTQLIERVVSSALE